MKYCTTHWLSKVFVVFVQMWLNQKQWYSTTLPCFFAISIAKSRKKKTSAKLQHCLLALSTFNVIIPFHWWWVQGHRHWWLQSLLGCLELWILPSWGWRKQWLPGSHWCRMWGSHDDCRREGERKRINESCVFIATSRVLSTLGHVHIQVCDWNARSTCRAWRRG